MHDVDTGALVKLGDSWAELLLLGPLPALTRPQMWMLRDA